MGEMVKICPFCGHHNPADAIYCENEICGNDLSLVEVTPSRLESAGVAREHTPPTAAPAPAPVRRQAVVPGPVPVSAMQAGRQCRGCGHIAPMHIMVCPGCGESLSIASIVEVDASQFQAATPAQSAGSWMLVSCDNEARLRIEEGQHLLIGWAGELGDYLERTWKEYVSNRHGMLSVVRGELFFEDSSRNGTLINDRPIPRGQAQKLSVGDILCLGGHPGVQANGAAYFRVDRR